jgi:hypothetical protein
VPEFDSCPTLRHPAYTYIQRQHDDLASKFFPCQKEKQVNTEKVPLNNTSMGKVKNDPYFAEKSGKISSPW